MEELLETKNSIKIEPLMNESATYKFSDEKEIKLQQTILFHILFQVFQKANSYWNSELYEKNFHIYLEDKETLESFKLFEVIIENEDRLENQVCSKIKKGLFEHFKFKTDKFYLKSNNEN